VDDPDIQYYIVKGKTDRVALSSVNVYSIFKRNLKLFTILYDFCLSFLFALGRFLLSVRLLAVYSHNSPYHIIYGIRPLAFSCNTD